MEHMPLAGYLVLDLTEGIAGPYCTKLLACYGAEVIKIERPRQGDPTRRMGPFFHDEAGPDKSCLFLYLNTSKKSVTLDLKGVAGRHIFLDLVRRADMVTESFPPGYLKELGLDYQSLEAIHPGLIMTSVTPFGQTGPYRDYKATEIVVNALAGLMYITGEPDRVPLQTGGYIAQYAAGQTAYVATLTALFHQAVTGEGQHVDVSMMEANVDNLENWVMGRAVQDKPMPRLGKRHQSGYPSEIYPCEDGYVAVNVGRGSWPALAEMMEEPRLLDPRYADPATRSQHRVAIDALMQPWLSAHGKVEVYHAGQARRMAFGYVATTEDVVRNPQLQDRDYFVRVEHPETGEVLYPGLPFRLKANDERFVCAPLLGEHTREVYGDKLGLTNEEMVTLKSQGVI